MKIAYLAPYSKKRFYEICGISDPSVKGKDVWFFQHIPDRSIDVDVVGCLGSFTYRKRIPLVVLQILCFLPLARGYDVVISGGFLNGILLSTARRIIGFRRPRHVIIDTRAFSALKPGLGVRLARFLLSPVEGVVCLSQAEQALWETHLGFRGRATWAPFAIDTDFPDAPMGDLSENSRYIFAGGSSFRDWATLVAVARDIDEEFVIVAGRDAASGKYGLEGIQIPPNVNVLFDVSGEEFKDLLAGSLFVVVPLQHVPFAVGTQVIAQAMACGKAVVATRIPTVVDYVREGETGLLVEPGNTGDLKDKLLFLARHPDQRCTIAGNAKKAMAEELGEAELGQRVWSMLQEVCAEA
jgi:glycosyltransferase involved in cell wall biosynthesis